MGFKRTVLLLAFGFLFGLMAHAQNSSASQLNSGTLLDPSKTLYSPADSGTSQSTSVARAGLEPKSRLRVDASWQFTLGGASLRESRDESAAAFLWAGLKFEARLTEQFRVKVNPRFAGNSSRVQERIDDDRFSDEFWIYDTYAAFQPIPQIELRAGALAQNQHGNSIVVSGLRSFPGAQLIGKTRLSEDIRAEFIVNRAIPTSHSLNDERRDVEPLPWFYSETLALRGEHLNEQLNWKLNAGHYAWVNIPNKVAFESINYGGNEYPDFGQGFDGEVTPGSRLKYGFDGWFGSTEVTYDTPAKLGLAFEYQRVRNTLAPDNAADAQLFGIGPRLRFGDRVLDVRYRPYFIESDVTVSAYSKSRFGRTNRQGYNIEANLDFKDLGFRVFAEIYRAKPIAASTYQGDLQIYYLGVETDYASF